VPGQVPCVRLGEHTHTPPPAMALCSSHRTTPSRGVGLCGEGDTSGHAMASASDAMERKLSIAAAAGSAPPSSCNRRREVVSSVRIAAFAALAVANSLHNHTPNTRHSLCVALASQYTRHARPPVSRVGPVCRAVRVADVHSCTYAVVRTSAGPLCLWPVARRKRGGSAELRVRGVWWGWRGGCCECEHRASARAAPSAMNYTASGFCFHAPTRSKPVRSGRDG
jgi:hypothetical protein